MSRTIHIAQAMVKGADGEYHKVPMFGSADAEQLAKRVSELEEELSGIRALTGEGVEE